MLHSHRWGAATSSTPNVDQSRRRHFSEKDKDKFQASSFYVCDADAATWQTFLANEGKVEFDFFGEMPADGGDVSKFSEHPPEDDDASRSSEHVAYKATWDKGTSRLPRPHHAQRDRAHRLVRSAGCKKFLMEIFAGAHILTLVAGSLGSIAPYRSMLSTTASTSRRAQAEKQPTHAS